MLGTFTKSNGNTNGSINNGNNNKTRTIYSSNDIISSISDGSNVLDISSNEKSVELKVIIHYINSGLYVPVIITTTIVFIGVVKQVARR